MTKKVLIIDDNLTTLKILQTAFTKQGWMSYGAKSALEALNLIYDTAPDIVITDAIMPIIGGFKFVRMLREDEVISKIPTIIYSTIEEKIAKFYIKKELGEYFLKKTSDLSELTGLARFVMQEHPVDMRNKLTILKKGIEKRKAKQFVEKEKQNIKKEKIKAIIEAPTKKEPEIIKEEKKEKNLTYYALIALFYDEENDEKSFSAFGSSILEGIKEKLNKNEKVYKNEFDEYSVIIYAINEDFAQKRLDEIISLIKSIDEKIEISIGAIEYENNLDFDMDEAYDIAFSVLNQTASKEKTVIKYAK